MAKKLSSYERHVRSLTKEQEEAKGETLRGIRRMRRLPPPIGTPKQKRTRRYLSVPERHQLKIARKTLTYSDVGAKIMGGPTKAEARQIIKRLTGRMPRE